MRQNIEKKIKKKKTIALKTTSSKDDESDEFDEEEEEEDLALIARKFKRFMGKKKQGFKKNTFKGEPSKEKEKEKEKELPIYFKCKKSSYFRIDYPFLKKSSKKIKKKMMMATWSDNEDSSFEEQT